MNRIRHTMILLYPIPFTPKLAEIGNEEIKKVSHKTHNASLAPVRIYTYFDFPSVTRQTRRKLLRSEKMFAMLSIRM